MSWDSDSREGLKNLGAALGPGRGLKGKMELERGRLQGLRWFQTVGGSEDGVQRQAALGYSFCTSTFTIEIRRPSTFFSILQDCSGERV